MNNSFVQEAFLNDQFFEKQKPKRFTKDDLIRSRNLVVCKKNSDEISDEKEKEMRKMKKIRISKRVLKSGSENIFHSKDNEIEIINLKKEEHNPFRDCYCISCLCLDD